MEVLKRLILSHLKHRDYKPVKPSVFARQLGVKKDEVDEFKKTLAQLCDAGQVVIGSKSLVALPPVSAKIYGTFRPTSKGFGFVVPLQANAHGDLFIAAEDTAGAMNGDTVVASVRKKPSRSGEKRYAGRIIEIVQRANNKFIGTVEQKNGLYFIIPDGKAAEPIELFDVTAKNVRIGDKVVVQIIDYATVNNYARGVIVETLGKAGLYETEINAIIRRFGLVDGFDSDCLAEVEKAAEAFRKFRDDGFSSRVDLTGRTIVTIDPPDARDFDDAISVEKKLDGTITLGVHIADVSFFVLPQSALDKEALKRGNSVYLPQKVLPMLPEVLSNGLCSLQPNQKRLAKSVFITYAPDGEIIKRDFANSVICSAARLTYTQADDVIKGKKAELSEKVVSLLKNMNVLAKAIEARRKKTGMLHLDLPETELVFDNNGRVIDAEPAEDCYPHTIIEMFMVEANDAVAVLFDSFNIPFMRRIHPEPDSLSLKGLSDILKMLGFGIGKNPTRFDLQAVVSQAKGKPASFAVNTYLLRSLSRAEYSPLNIGHFALASRHYCHFTSPIRRYADLLIHRLLEIYFKNGRLTADDDGVLQTDELAKIGKDISYTDKRAEDAEEQLKTTLILEFMKDKLGEQIETTISGLTNFGLFVRCNKFGIEGLIAIEQLGSDRFVYDHKAQCIYGVRSGKIYHIGMPLKVKIVSVNVSAGKLDVAPVFDRKSENKREEESMASVAKKNKKKKMKLKNKRQINKKKRR